MGHTKEKKQSVPESEKSQRKEKNQLSLTVNSRTESW